MTPGNTQHAGEDPATGHPPEDPGHLPPFQPKWCRKAQDWLVCTGNEGACEHVHMHMSMYICIRIFFFTV